MYYKLLRKLLCVLVCLNFLFLAALAIPDAVFSEDSSSSVIELPVTLMANITSPLNVPVTFVEAGK